MIKFAAVLVVIPGPMTEIPQLQRASGWSAWGGFVPLPLFVLQPILTRVVKRVARLHPSLFDRLGPHRHARYVIDAQGLPFVLFLVPDPEALQFRAVARRHEPPGDARIQGGFFDLLGLVDGETDGDALFFSRALNITGNTEAVVCLRNALDDVEGSIAGDVAGMFGRPGRAVLSALRRAGNRGGGNS